MENRLKKYYFVVIGGTILSCAIMFILFNIFTKDGTRVIVSLDGENVESFLIDEDMEYTILDGDNYNILQIKDGYASIIEASCENQICVHSRKIHNVGETIICLPNKVVISIEGEGAEYDAYVR